MKYYFTIRADVKESKQNKKYKDLEKIAENVNKDLSLICKDTNTTLIKMTVRAGDELFSIYKCPNIALEALQLLLINAKKYKIPLYIGCGIGTLENISENENLVNGDSIWRATTALDKIKIGIPKYNEKLSGDLSLKIYFNDDNNINKIYQTLIFLLSEKVLKRTDLQNNAVLLLKKNNSKEYHELYDLLAGSINTSTKIDDKRIKYTKYLQRAEYHIVNDLMEIIINKIKKEDF